MNSLLGTSCSPSLSDCSPTPTGSRTSSGNAVRNRSGCWRRSGSGHAAADLAARGPPARQGRDEPRDDHRRRPGGHTPCAISPRRPRRRALDAYVSVRTATIDALASQDSPLPKQPGHYGLRVTPTGVHALLAARHRPTYLPRRPGPRPDPSHPRRSDRRRCVPRSFTCRSCRPQPLPPCPRRPTTTGQARSR